MKLDLTLLNNNVNTNRLVKKSIEHSLIKLYLYRYTNIGKKSNMFDLCKGLLVSDTGQVFGRQFEKIREFGKDDNKTFPLSQFNVYNFYDGIPIYLTRIKSNLLFYSDLGDSGEELTLAKEIFNDNVKDPIRNIPEGFTYTFQLISPKFSRIITYPEDKLILISIYNTKINKEVDHIQLFKFNYPVIVNDINNFRIKDVYQYLKSDDDFSRGVILHFVDKSSGINKRIKITYPSYSKKFNIIKELKLNTIVKYLDDNEDPFKLYNFSELPDRFTEWVTSIVKEYKKKKPNYENIKPYFREECVNNLI